MFRCPYCGCLTDSLGSHWALSCAEPETAEERRMTQVWISYETYRRLLAVRGAMRRADGKIRTIDETIAELIEFWKKHVKA